jgi:phospholipid-binding lipoprotein MlaA
MKSLLVSLLLACSQFSQFPAKADDQTPPGSPRMSEAARDSEEQEFHDPFTKQEERAGAAKLKVPDPLEPMNRAFFRFNDRLYFWVLKPVAKGYNKVAPEPFRASVTRFFLNARYPVRFVNNLLQGKLKSVGVETARFVVNSTVGIGGLFDPARDEWNLQPRTADLDQTLGLYRLPPGIYFDWPGLGPSSVRGTVGLVGDGFLSPWTYVDGPAVFFGMRLFDTVNATSLQLGEYESFKQATFDPYVALRDAYYEHRRSLVDQ